MTERAAPRVGPVMAFTAKREEVIRFYAEIAGLPTDGAGDPTWFAAGNAELVVHGPDDPQTDAQVRAQRGFVVWFGVDDIASTFARARGAGCVVGDFQGDFFFARDPDGRIVGFHANEDHGHAHEHGEHGHDH